MDQANMEIERCSPLRFDQTARTVIEYENWTVVGEYFDEGDGPWLIDISHHIRWDLQDSALDTITGLNRPIPRVPGQCTLENGVVIGRMNHTQAAIWYLTRQAPYRPDHSGWTDVTDASCLIALVGKDIYRIMEKATSMDICGFELNPPCLLQGPIFRVPCQLVHLSRKKGRETLLIACRRGYAGDMVHNLRKVGAKWGLSPAGENRLKREWEYPLF